METFNGQNYVKAEKLLDANLLNEQEMNELRDGGQFPITTSVHLKGPEYTIFSVFPKSKAEAFADAIEQHEGEEWISTESLRDLSMASTNDAVLGDVANELYNDVEVRAVISLSKADDGQEYLNINTILEVRHSEEVGNETLGQAMSQEAFERKSASA
jgi:hypothetical protein